MAGKKQTFEQMLEKLEAVVAKMESPDTGLEACLKLYKEGLALSLSCGERLSGVEAEVTALRKSFDEKGVEIIVEEPFDMAD